MATYAEAHRKRSEALLELPAAPPSEAGAVKAWRQPVAMSTCLPRKPDPNPMFLDKRVYQGSSGRVYPLPFIDRIELEPEAHEWQAVHIENEFLRLMILPEIGGRIHVGLDKTSGYDFFYRQNVIKPALVGLAGPWVSGGVEFNWPQHHRPATFMPVEVEIERAEDGSVTVWCSDHDPMNRLKGMHGVCLHPARAYVEVKVRLYNRTRFEQTFLWWANVATRVHAQYQSFFPGDVAYVADHAKRAISTFPLADGKYYGVDYGERATSGVRAEERPRLNEPDGSYPANDLSWYANIPVPTSYMVARSNGDFLGGYDHAKRAGVVHVANHHIAPGKKQWTWGNHEFGYAWDRNLTDSDGPYIELMAGVYTDNQPDFSYLAAGETKSFSQFWYPIKDTGAPQSANLNAAVSARASGGRGSVAAYATRELRNARLRVYAADRLVAEYAGHIAAAETVKLDFALPEGLREQDLSVLLEDGEEAMFRYSPAADVQKFPAPEVARELPLPAEIASLDELYLAGVHLRQYRHATRMPEIYWQEALRREPSDSRSNIALGSWHFHRGEFGEAEQHLRRGIAALTRLNPNPPDGECFYLLGLALRAQQRDQEAYAAFYKGTWNLAQRSAAYHALAEIDAAEAKWTTALDHLRSSLRFNTDHLNARNLAVVALRRLGMDEEAGEMLAETRRLDRLDIWSRYLESGIAPEDNRLRIDLALDYARAGLWGDAIDVLAEAETACADGSAPMALYTLAWLHRKKGDRDAAAAAWQKAAAATPLYCFPSRLEDIEILEAAIAANPQDSFARYYLGNLLYDRRRHEEAIALWEQSVDLNETFPTAWRNLGIGYFNTRKDVARSLEAFERAIAADPKDARILFERDQLWKRAGVTPEKRLAALERRSDLLPLRDDLTTEAVTLYNLLGKPEEALSLLTARRFQPWEGGEGLVLGQWTRTNLLLGHRELQAGDTRSALAHYEAAIASPDNLGEAKHLLANQSEGWYWLGVAWKQLGDGQEAAKWWRKAARQQGDFLSMRVEPVSEMTYWSGLALMALGERETAQELFREIERYSWELESRPATIDYFATSLPTMLLFEEDLGERNRAEALLLRAQARLGAGLHEEAAELIEEALLRDVNHATAWDLLRAAGGREAIAAGGDACK